MDTSDTSGAHLTPDRSGRIVRLHVRGGGVRDTAPPQPTEAVRATKATLKKTMFSLATG